MPTPGCLHSVALPPLLALPLARQLLWHSINWTLWRIRCALSAPKIALAALSLSLLLPIRVAVGVAVPVATLDPQAGIAGVLKHPRASPGLHSCMQCLCKFIYAKETQSSPGFGCNLLTTRVTLPERQCCLVALAYVQRAVHTDEVVSPLSFSPSCCPSSRTELTLPCSS